MAKSPMLNDVARLRDSFYAAFDRSRLEALLSRGAAELYRGHARLGEGAHFAAWRIRATELVVKVARPGIYDPGTPAHRQWVQALGRARGLGGLLPPFEVLEAEGRIGLVMPYGDQPLAAAAAHWQPVADRLGDLDRALARAGLELADVSQGRCWRGVPFLYDLSDLRLRPLRP